jgi:hypothetical protein
LEGAGEKLKDCGCAIATLLRKKKKGKNHNRMAEIKKETCNLELHAMHVQPSQPNQTPKPQLMSK